MTEKQKEEFEAKTKGQLTLQDIKIILERIKASNQYYKVSASYWKSQIYALIPITLAFIVWILAAIISMERLFLVLAPSAVIFVAVSMIVSSAIKCYWEMRVAKRAILVKNELEILNKSEEYQHLEWECDDLASFISVKMKNISYDGELLPEPFRVPVKRSPSLAKNLSLKERISEVTTKHSFRTIPHDKRVSRILGGSKFETEKGKGPSVKLVSVLETKKVDFGARGPKKGL